MFIAISPVLRIHRMAHLGILILAGTVSLAAPRHASAGNINKRCKQAETMHKYSGTPWNWGHLGAKIDENNTGYEMRSERYFVGEPIRGRIYISGRSYPELMTKQDLDNVPKCLLMKVYRLVENEDGKLIKEKTPFASGSLEKLGLDERSRWNQSWNHARKEEKFPNATKEVSKWRVSDEFMVREIIGQQLPAGKYVVSVVPDNELCNIFAKSTKTKCKKPVFSVHKDRIVWVYKPNTRRLKAMKKCWEGRKMITSEELGFSDDIEVWKKAVERNFLPATKIHPGVPCAWGGMKAYFLKKGNRKKYEEYSLKGCRAHQMENLRRNCLERRQNVLENWEERVRSSRR
jgi:hypothetical protein